MTTISKDKFTLNLDGSITLTEDSLPSFTDVASDWIVARAGETSTKLGIIGGAVATPTILDNVGKAVIAGLAGDYITAAQHGIPALIGIVGAIGAIVTSDKPTNDQIKNTISAMSRDELISLLTPPTSVLTPPTVIQPSGVTGNVATTAG